MCTDQEKPGDPIVRLDGVPREAMKEEEKSRFKRFVSIFPHLLKTVALGRKYIRAKVTQEENKAKKTAAEAAEIAARKELQEQEAATERQREVQEFSKNVDDIFKDDGLPPDAKMLKMAKYL